MNNTFSIAIVAVSVAIATVAYVYYNDPAYRHMRWQDAEYKAAAMKLDLRREAIEVETEALALARERAEAQRAEARAPLNLQLELALYVALSMVALVALLAAVMTWWRRSQLVYANAEGVLPVARRDVERGFLNQPAIDMLLMRSEALVRAASHAPVPGHYSPHIAYHNRSEGSTPLLEHAAQATAPIPTFAELLARGQVGRDAPLLLGFDAASAEAMTGSWQQLFSTGLGGLQGSGKTWTVVCLLMQNALCGGRMVICDPHAGHEEESLAARVAPLHPAFLCDIASSDAEVLDALKLANDELQRRKQGHPDRTPLIVAIDEWGSLRRGESRALRRTRGLRQLCLHPRRAADRGIAPWHRSRRARRRGRSSRGRRAGASRPSLPTTASSWTSPGSGRNSSSCRSR